jgi:hypothetical protein
MLGLMLRICIYLLASSFAAASYGAAPIIDNERVTVWDATSALPPAEHPSSRYRCHKRAPPYWVIKALPSKDGARTIVIELKDNSRAPIPNYSGYPSAFPRPHSKNAVRK